MLRYTILICLIIASVSNIYSQEQYKSGVVKIGLLVPADTTIDQKSRELARVANLAILQKNKQGGINGQPVQIVVKFCDGRWGAASKQSVDLVYEDRVKVIIGAVGGKNAHLAEQVATKAQIVFLSTQANDPTLSQINIPWFFRMNIGDIQISETLLEHFYVDGDESNTVIVSEEGYDYQMAKGTFDKAIRKQNFTALEEVTIHDFVDRRWSKKFILYFGSEEGAKKLMKTSSGNTIFYGGNDLIRIREINSNKLLVPLYSDWDENEYASFRKNYYNHFGEHPSFQSVYTFDGVKMMLKIFEMTNTDQNQLKKVISASEFEGITGNVQFDKQGNRIGNIQFLPVSTFQKP